MDQRVICPGCNQPQSRKNISRHVRLCKKMVDLVNGPDEKSRSRSSSRDTGCSGSVSVSENQQSCMMQYSPIMSTMMMSVIQEAVQALLEQHDRYDVSQLTAYLGSYYSEIPENMRAPIVVAATAAARQAAQLHYVWRDNRDSPDGSKRHYAASAASSLSFWALGLRPASRSGNAYARQEYSSVAERQEEAAVGAPALSSTVIAEAADIPQSSSGLDQRVELPVQIDGDDPEFSRMMSYYQGQLQLSNPLLSPIVSTLSSEVAEVAPFATASTVTINPANVPGDISVGEVSRGIPAQKRSTEGRPAQVEPAADGGLAAATITRDGAPAAVQSSGVEPGAADGSSDARELEEPLVIHAPSEIEDSTPPVAKTKKIPGDAEEVTRARRVRDLSKSPTNRRQATPARQFPPGKRHQGNESSFSRKRFCPLQQRGRSPPRSSRPPNRSRREDKVTLTIQEYQEYVRLRRHDAHRK